MALTVPNLDRISKENPKLGEALRTIEVFTNINVVPAPGNRQGQLPGFVSSVAPSTTPVQQPQPSAPVQNPAPPTIVSDPRIPSHSKPIAL